MTQALNVKKKPAEVQERNRPERQEQDEAAAPHPVLQLQRAVGNRAMVQLLQSHGHLQTKQRSADREAAEAPHLTFASGGLIQRKCATCTPAAKCAECEEEDVKRKTKNSSLSAVPLLQRAPRNGNSTAAPETAASTGALIVDDESSTVAPGQMRKSEFLGQLRSTVCATADGALKAAGESTEGCPYIEKWLSYYEEQEPSYIERALRKYAPEAAAAGSARDFISAVNNRVLRAVEKWVQTGEVTGVPDELAGMLPGAGGGLGAIAGVLGSIGSAIGGAISAAAGAIGSAFSSIGKALFKRKEGSANQTDDPREIQAQLSSGRPLDGGVMAQMGAAFGQDFSGVRVHTGGEAAGLSEQLNARAFTVGSDIAFGAGEYQPGTLIGDALIAHELAHVTQQKGAAASAPATKAGSVVDPLETEADDAAINVVGALHGGFRVRDHRSTSLTALRLQNCSKKPPQIKVPRGAWATPEQADQLLANDPVIYPRIKDRVAKGRKAAGHTQELGSIAYLAQATELSGDEAQIERVSREMMYAGGFADVDKGEIYLHRKDADMIDVTRGGKMTPVFVPPSATPVTIVHEAVHLYGNTAWYDTVGHPANEGTTEYFTRRVLEKQENKEVEGGKAILARDSYPEEYEAVKCLVSKANVELLADAYFLGKIEPLRKKVGATKIDDWSAAMKEKNFVDAHAAVGCKPPKPQPEE